ncbi:H(+)/Cl(-) exchange transporter ClcA [Thiocapsa marina]|uniref:Cl-channel voltage-gated family protein n=1 Tax=Thiocapsa marina 5811 TaxID=768671 RepID=F9UB96_9GAMM|nr:H(+)/Cl(-) exchange transporter ClcA [Thiocapsa marina]EGV18714.1 Cl- channel voltage-gated family protein [Thiocapsa marina 5811]
MTFPWRLYLAATLVGVLTGLIGAAFHALLDQAAASRGDLKALLEAAPVPGWLLLMLLGASVLVTAMWLVRRFAPETAGSGVQEVEAILAGERQLRWKRVLPVKFVAGALAVGSGLVLGREGPTIHMGAALGQMAGERIEPRPGANRALIAAGAAAGLATAFNAPIASIVFVTEELREHFEYRFETIQSVILASCAAVIVSGWMLGQGPDMAMPDLGMAPLEALPLFLVLGILIGALGVLFNGLVLGSVASFRALGTPGAYSAAAVAGLMLGALLWFAPNTVGGGEGLVESLVHGQPALFFLIALLAVRLLTSIGSYGLGLPGGIFAPLLALGTICGAAFAALITLAAPTLALAPEMFAVAAMGALFAATVRAPLTGIILVIELTGAQALALPIIITCLAATFTAEGLGGRPIYSSLLGLQQQAPPRAPARRILAAAMLLVAFVAIERLDVAFQGTGMEPGKTLAETPAEPPAQVEPPIPAVADQPADVSGTRADEPLVASSAPAAPAFVRSRPTAVESAPSTEVGVSESTLGPTGDRESVTDERLASAELPWPPTSTESAPERAADPDPSEEQATLALVGTTSAPSDQGSAIKADARFSIQLISYRSIESLARFAEEEGLLGKALKLQTDAQGARWHPVLLGAYADRIAAESALANLPARLRRLDPMIRPLAPDERLVPIASR